MTNLCPTAIKVIGIGGGAQNAMNRMMAEGMSGVEFIAVDSDQAALSLSKASVRVASARNQAWATPAWANAPPKPATMC